MNALPTVLLTAALVLVVGVGVLFYEHANARAEAARAEAEVAAAAAAAAAAAERGAGGGAATEATTDDARDLVQLWSDLEALQRDAPELGADELKATVVARTAEFLRLDAEGEARFAAVVDRALDDLRGARERMEQANREAAARAAAERATTDRDGVDAESPESVLARRAQWRRWQDEQRRASDRLLEVFERTPRHRLLAEQRLLWLLRIDYGIQPAVVGGR